jgi:hypothetical protein
LKNKIKLLKRQTKIPQLDVKINLTYLISRGTPTRSLM